MRLFADIVLFMALAMGLGIGIGFLLWRWRRYTVNSDEWEQQRQLLEAQAVRLNEFGARSRAVAEASHHNGEDAQRRREMLQSLRLERDRLASALELAQHDAIEARLQRDELSVQLASVQRRLAELSINQARSRLSGVRRGEQPMPVPPAAERACRIRLPDPPAVPGRGSPGDEPQGSPSGEPPPSEPPPSIERPARPVEGGSGGADHGQHGAAGRRRAPGVAG